MVVLEDNGVRRVNMAVKIELLSKRVKSSKTSLA